MADTTGNTNVSVPDSASSPYEGVSTPSQVTSDTGNGNTDTPLSSQAQPAQSQPSPQTSPQPAQAQQPGQSAQPTQAGTPGAKSAQQPQTPGQPAPTTPPVNPQVAAAKQKASGFYEVAQVLAGGPRYTYNVDDNGNMQKTQVPVSGKHLALAIAMEALSGMAAGFGAKPGPGVEGRAAAAGFAQVQKQQADQDQAQKAQAQQDFARKAQVTETNMRMLSMARTVGKMDNEATDGYIKQYEPLLAHLKQVAPDSLEGPIKYSDFAKYNVTTDNAIPFMRIPRLGPDGKQVNDARGNPQWDVDYYIVKPGMKLTDLLDKNDQATAKKMGLSWAGNDSVLSSPMALDNALNLKSRLAGWNVSEAMFNNIFKEGDAIGQKMPEGATKLNELAETSEASAGVDPKYIKALIQHESSGDPNAKSPTGAKGLMQLTPNMGPLYPQDPFNPAQNVKAGTQYFAQLLQKYDNDPKKAFAAYYSGPQAISPTGQILATKDHTAAQTQGYVNSVLSLSQTNANFGDKTVGGGEAGATNPAAPQRMSLEDWNAKYPTTPSDLEAFRGAVNGLPSDKAGMLGDALAWLHSKGQDAAANNIAAYLNQGNPNFIQNHDDALTAERAQRKTDMASKAIEDRAAVKQKSDTDAHDKKEAMLSTMETAKVPDNSLQMDPKDVIDNLTKQGVTLPPEGIRDAMAIARYEAPINVASNKLWFKDQSLTQQDLLDVVRQFNPTYDVGNYANIHSFTTANSKPSQTFQAAAAVSNHLNQLVDLAHAVKSGAGQYPLMNKLENDLNYHTGGSDYSRLQALTAAVNDEMGRVLSGGFAPQKGQVEQIMNNMTAANSDQQIEALAKLYTGVMHGKVAPYDEQYNQLSGAADKHLQNIPESFNKLAQKYGYETPWVKGSKPQPQVQSPYKPGDASQYTQISKSGRIGMDANGTKYIISTGQQIQ